MSAPISTLGLTCPLGGKFYICQGNTTQFLGCCTSDPCAGGKGSCPQADLRYSSFDAAHYADVKTQACAGAGAGSWYTCSGAGLKNPFMGCCSSNACANATAACPQQNLLAAKLSDNTISAAPFVTTTAAAAAAKSTSASATKSTSVGTSSTRAASSSAVTGPSSASAAAAQSGTAVSSGLPAGARAGIGAGCAVLAVALIGAVFLFVRRRQRDRKGVVVQGAKPPSPGSNMMTDSQAAMIHRNDPNQILWSPREPRAPLQRSYFSPPSSSRSSSPFTPVFAAKRPNSWRRSFSTNSFSTTSTASFSTADGSVSRQASLRSGSSNGGFGSPPPDGSSQQRLYTEQYASPPPQIYISPPGDYLGHKQQHQALETVAELDGSDISRPIILPRSTYRP